MDDARKRQTGTGTMNKQNWSEKINRFRSFAGGKSIAILVTRISVAQQMLGGDGAAHACAEVVNEADCVELEWNGGASRSYNGDTSRICCLMIETLPRSVG